MITAAVAPVVASSDHAAAWATVFALLTVFAIVAVLYQHERRSDRQTARIDTHDEQLAELAYQMPALLKFLKVEIPAPVADDSPEAMAAEAKPDEMPTDEIPIAPATVPDGMPLAVQTALIERPSPVRRYPEEFPAPIDSDDVKAQRAAWVEEQLREIRARIDAAQGAS